MYGDAERSLSAALAGTRESAIVATKIWAGSAAEGRPQLQRQLEWFGRVEVEQLHNLVAWEEQVSWLEQEQAEGRIGGIGVTHYSASAFGELERALATGRFETLQVPLNPFECECEGRLLPLAAELGVRVIVMRPLGKGSLLRNRPRPEQLEPLRALGITSWPQALLKSALSDGRVDVVVPATRNPTHVWENAAAGRPPWLGPGERRLVERLAGL